MMKTMAIWMALALCIGCTVSSKARPHNADASYVASLDKPYLPWTISHLAPDYMEAYLVGVVVFDVQGRLVPNARSGMASMRTPSYEYARAQGWPSKPGVGSANDVISDLPKSIIVNWRSRVEDFEYYLRIDIAQDVREHMTQKHMVLCPKATSTQASYRNNLVIGLAPGGIVKLWINGLCLEAKEVGRYEAKRVSNPERDNKPAAHAPNLGEKTQEFLRHHPVPYGSW